MTARYNLSKGATNEPHGEDSLPRSTAFRPCPECGAESEWELDHRQCSVCAYRHGARPARHVRRSACDVAGSDLRLPR
jgi:hypothetical protein